MRARIAAVAWLFAVAGCNQVFGNNQVSHLPVDVIPGIDAAFGTMQLTWMDEPSALAPVSMDAIAGARVQVGSGTDLTDLQDRPIDATGTFTVPYEILQLAPRYRLVYTPADGIPVEIQTTLKTAHFVVPQVGRIDRTVWPRQPTLPAGGHVDFDGGGWPTSYAHLRFLGTGLWSNLEIGACCAPTNFLYVNYSRFLSDSGLLGVPMSASGDKVLVTESPDATSGVTGYGYLTFDGFDGGGMALNQQYSPWTSTGANTNLRYSSTVIIGSYGFRASNLVSGAADPYTNQDTVNGGVVATTGVQPFTDLVINGIDPGAVTGEYERAVFATLSQNTSLTQSFRNPFTGALPAFPTAVYQFGSSVHTFAAESVKVRSGVQEILLNDGSGTESDFDEGVGIASMIYLAATGHAADAKNISGGASNADQILVPRSGATTFESRSASTRPPPRRFRPIAW